MCFGTSGLPWIMIMDNSGQSQTLDNLIVILASKEDCVYKTTLHEDLKINVSTFALLFAEIVRYCQNKVYTVPELQTRLSEMGQHVGVRVLDLVFFREKNLKRETKVVNMLNFIKGNLWKTLFGKEADMLEQDNDDDKTYYIIEKEPLVNKFISVPKDKGTLNCSAFTAGIIEAVLNGCSFPCKVTVHRHKGTTYMIKFDESVITRDKTLEGR